MIRRPFRFHRTLLFGLCFAAGIVAPRQDHAQDSLPPGLADEVKTSVVEVVRAKNTRDIATYTEAPGADLVPYAERVDPWMPVGTAFSLGNGRFVTAAHVLSLDRQSEAGAWAVRFSDGRVLSIGRLRRFSTIRDFAEFEVPGATAPALPLNPEATPNTRVYAAGNALGQGVVVRDGILTSTTPEAKSGAWRWIRFSAAASPGNSGGPLIDSSGKVVGLVVMKSENENLNYALPVAEFDKIPDGRLEYSLDDVWTFPALGNRSDARASFAHDGALSLAEASTLAVAARNEAYAQARTAALGEDRANVFPLAASAGPLLDMPVSALFPQLANTDSNGSWRLSQPDKLNSSALPDGAALQWGDLSGETFFSLAKAPGEKIARYATPSAVMDRYLAGRPLFRTIGDRDFRISSLGPAYSSRTFRDSWGRQWTLAAWVVPDIDFVELACYLPTPSGFAGYARGLPRSDLAIAQADAAALADFVHLSYSGTIADWKDFLSADSARPAWLDGYSMDLTDGMNFSISCADFSASPPPVSPGVASDSLITLNPWWFVDPGTGSRRLSFSMLLVYSPAKGYAYLQLFKQPKPGPSAAQPTRDFWRALLTGGSPFTMIPYSSNGFTYDADVVDFQSGADPDFVYALSIRFPGDQESARTSGIFPLVKDSIKISDAERAAGKMGKPVAERAKIGGFDIFASIAAGDEASFSAFLKQSDALSDADESGDTPLTLALRLGKEDFAARLVAAGADIDSRNGDGDTALLLALRNGDDDLARAIVAKTKRPDLASPSGAGPLVVAMPQSFGDLPERILAAGASPGAAANAEAVGAAIAAGRYDLAAKLADSGFPLDARYRDGWSVVLFAIEAGKPELALDLLERGAPFDIAAADGHTPLIEALRLGQRQVADRLIALGASWKTSTSDGWTPLLLACRQGYATEAFLFIENGTSLLDSGPGATTVLHQAAASFDKDDIRHLLELGASILERTRDAGGRTPADVAAAAGHPDIAALLSGG